MRRISSFLIIIALVMVMPGIPARASEPAARVASAAAPALTASSDALGASPLPRGCGGVTSPGQPEAACCVNGFVYVDGQPVAGAEVQVQNHAGDQITLVTQVYSGTETRPYYRLSLTAPPLSVQAGETISVTARYGGTARSLPYLVQPGGQQVDVVLARAQAEGYQFERLMQGRAEPRQFNGIGGMAVDGAGNSYIVDVGNQRVQVFGSDKQLLGVWGTPGSQPGQFRSPSGIAVDRSGNVYVSDIGNYRIQKFSSSGQFILAWGSEGSANGQFYSPDAVGVDAAGNVYVSDRYNSRIQKFSSRGTWLAAWEDLSTAALGISVDSNGDIYVLGDRYIDKFDSNGDLLAAWDGLFNADDPDLPDDPVGISADTDAVYVTAGARIYRFSPALQLLNSWNTLPTGFARGGSLAVDHGYLYAADLVRDRVLKFRLTITDGYVYDSWGDTGKANGQFYLPQSTAISAGKLYVLDSGNNRVQVFDANGGWLATWGVVGDAPGQFIAPTAIATDTAGNLYVADPGNNRIQRRDTAGNWTVLGTFGQSPGQFYRPEGVAVDSVGNIYVSDSGWNRVQKRDTAGNWSVIANQGQDLGQVRYPYALAADSAGNLYVTERMNNRVQKRDSAGNWSVWSSSGNVDGQIVRPDAISIDSLDRVYVSDRANGRIQKFTSAGTWLATLGGLGKQPGLFGDYYSAVVGLSVGADGRIFVADYTNNRVQVFRPMTATRPIATIQYLSSTTIAANGSLTAIGMGQDSDETPAIAAYRWNSDRDGVLGTAATLNISAASLSPGAHQLSFTVQDGEGEWSDPVSVDLYVALPPQSQWTMLLYLAGDYADGGRLLNAFDSALNTLRQSFRNPYVRIAVQLDGPEHGDTLRLLITPGSANTAAQVVTLPYEEQAMDDPTVLTDFVRWGQSSFPAAHYYLSVADHGQGIEGLAWDSTSDSNGGAYLTAQELGQALSAPGIAPIDVLQLDACAMNLLEVAYEVAHQPGHQVAFMIASQYLGWDYFAYAAYQSAIGATTSPRELARAITTEYAALAHADQHPYTIAALDLSHLPLAHAALDHLATELLALVDNGQLTLASLNTIRQASQTFESNGDYVNNQLDLYVDLVDWAQHVRDNVASSAVHEAAEDLLTVLTGPQPLIITSMAESNPLPPQYANGAYIDLTGSNGLSIFYPQQQDSWAFQSYVTNQLFSFTSVSRWPDFLQAGGGLLCHDCLTQPHPGPLAALSNQRQMFIPLFLR